MSIKDRLRLLKRPSFQNLKIATSSPPPRNRDATPDSSCDPCPKYEPPSPSSGFKFVDESQGADAAVAELASSLDDAVEHGQNDQLSLKLDRLIDEAAKYRNSGLGDGTGKEWRCSRNEAELISIACSCASAVYDPEEVPGVPGLEFGRIAYAPHPSDVMVRAAGFWKVQKPSQLSKEKSLLVVTIQGTARTAEIMAGESGKRADASSFLSFPSKTLTPDARKPIHAQVGFLDAAKSLLPLVSAHINSAATDQQTNHILFTSHSSGGAIASLLFAHLLCQAPRKYPTLTFSSVTFGAPGSMRPNITPRLLSLSRQHSLQHSLSPITTNTSITATNQNHKTTTTIILNFANEADLVLRLDRAYIHSLVDLYRSRYSLPPVTDFTPIASEHRPSTASSLVSAISSVPSLGLSSAISSSISSPRSLNPPSPTFASPLCPQSAVSATPLSPVSDFCFSAFTDACRYSRYEWMNPTMEYCHIGEVVVLKNSIETLYHTPAESRADTPTASSCSASDCDDSTRSKSDSSATTDSTDILNLEAEIAAADAPLKAVKMNSEKLGKLLFAQTDVHSRLEYTRRVKLMLEGKCNGDRAWEEVEELKHKEKEMEEMGEWGKGLLWMF